MGVWVGGFQNEAAKLADDGWLWIDRSTVDSGWGFAEPDDISRQQVQVAVSDSFNSSVLPFNEFTEEDVGEGKRLRAARQAKAEQGNLDCMLASEDSFYGDRLRMNSTECDGPHFGVCEPGGWLVWRRRYLNPGDRI